MKKLWVVLLLVVRSCRRPARAGVSVAVGAAGGWRTETMAFPLEFAPQLKYSGVEAIRFAPGFRDPSAPDYFTYAFVWLVDDRPSYPDWRLPGQLRDYFAGLMASVAKEKHWPHGGTSTHAAYTEVPTNPPTVLVDTWDAFFTGKPLHLEIRVSKLETHLAGKRLLYFEVSPNMRDERIQRALAGVRAQLQP